MLRVPTLRRSTRKRLFRGALYAVFVALVVLVAVNANWGRVQEQFFQVDIARDQFPDIVTVAAKNTVLFTFGAFAGGLLLGLTLALMKMSSIAPYRWLATVYIEIFRGLPVLLTLIGVAIVLPLALDIRVPGGQVGSGLAGLIIVAGAYMAETIRAGIQAVPKGQIEAAKSLGMSELWTTISVVLPQALRIVIPPLTNEFVLLIKDTALLFLIGMTVADRELTTFSRAAIQQTGNGTPLVMAAMMYLLITIPLTQLVAWTERRSARLTR